MTTDTGYEDPDPGSEIFVPKASSELPMDWLRLAQVISNIFVSVTPVILSIILLDAK